jgi:hypothetical protein
VSEACAWSHNRTRYTLERFVKPLIGLRPVLGGFGEPQRLGPAWVKIRAEIIAVWIESQRF